MYLKGGQNYESAKTRTICPSSCSVHPFASHIGELLQVIMKGPLVNSIGPFITLIKQFDNRLI